MLAVFYRRRISLLKVRDPTGRQTLRGARILRRDLMREYGSRKSAQNTATVIASQAYGIVSGSPRQKKRP